MVCSVVSRLAGLCLIVASSFVAAAASSDETNFSEQLSELPMSHTPVIILAPAPLRLPDRNTAAILKDQSREEMTVYGTRDEDWYADRQRENADYARMSARFGSSTQRLNSSIQNALSHKSDNMTFGVGGEPGKPVGLQILF